MGASRPTSSPAFSSPSLSPLVRPLHPAVLPHEVTDALVQGTKGVVDGWIRSLAAPGQTALVYGPGVKSILPVVAQLDPAVLGAPASDVRESLGGCVASLLFAHAAIAPRSIGPTICIGRCLVIADRGSLLFRDGVGIPDGFRPPERVHVRLLRQEELQERLALEAARLGDGQQQQVLCGHPLVERA